MILVDAGVHEFAEADLLEFAYAVGTAGAFTGGGEGGQQHGSQNRDDSDYHRKCDDGKCRGGRGKPRSVVVGGFL